MKKVINILMLSTIIMSQMTFGLTALAVEIDTNESSEVVTEETSSTEKDKESTFELDNSILGDISKLDDLSDSEKNVSDLNNKTEFKEELMGPLDEATPRGSTMTAELSRITFPLGSPTTTIKKIAEENAVVKIDNKVVGPEDYYLTISDSNIDKDNLNHDNSSLYLYFNDKTNPVNSAHANPTYRIDRGSSIEFNKANQSKRSGTYTLHTDASPWIITGNNADGSRNDLINESYSGKDYYKIDLFRMKENQNSIVIDDSTVPTRSFSAKGNETKDAVLNRWNENNRVQDGDIIRTWSADPLASELYYQKYSGGPNLPSVSNYASDDGYAFYEVTKQGFNPITTTFLEIVQQDITTTTTNEKLDQMAVSSFKEVPSNVTVEGFTEYPSRAKEGISYGKIKVSETLPYNGERLERIYKVPFNVIEQPLELNLKEIDIPLATKQEYLKASDFIESVTYDGEKLDEEDYIAEIVDPPGTHYVDYSDAKIEVRLVKDESIKAVEVIPADIMWMDTIVSRDHTSNTSTIITAISLLNHENKPYLSMSGGKYGDNASNKAKAQTRVAVYRNNMENSLFDQTTPLSKTNTDIFGSWMPIIDKLDLKYGDVLSQEVIDNSDGAKGLLTYISRDEKLVRETEGFKDALYELTPTGYRLMHGNQFKVKSDIPTFDTGTSIETMNQQAGNQLTLPAGAKASDYRYEYASVDTKTPGKKTTKMNVYEKLATGGEFMTTYNVSYEVVESLEDLKIELQEVTMPVGTKTEWLNANDYVKEVRLGDKKLASSEYTASFVKVPDTNLVSTNTYSGDVKKQKTQITIETKETKQTQTKETETMIVWGNTITTKTNGLNLTMTSISLIENANKPYLVANNGIGFSGTGIQFDPTISLYRNNLTNNLIKDGTSTGLTTHSSLTRDKWNTTFNSLDYQYGDVFGYNVKNSDGTSALGKRTWVSRNENIVLETEGFPDAYYELTKEGYRLMHFNQFTANSTIPSFEIGTTKEDMDKVAKEQLVLPKGADANNYRYEYVSVDTKTPGKKTTKMNVYEKLATGGEFMTTYDVQYNVVEDSTMSVELKEQNAFLGADATKLTAKNYVSKIYFGDKVQASGYFEAEFVERPNTNLLGKQKAKIKVYEKSNPSNFVIEESTTVVLWGNNIGALRKPGSDSFDSSVSMIDSNGKPTLRANEGNGLSTHSSLNTEPNLKVYRSNDTKILYEAKTKTKSQKASKLMTTWQSEFDGYDLVYGDVVSYTIPGQKGANTVTARSEELVTETAGFDSAYYELTKDGYRLMRANQFTVNSTVPKFDVGTSLEEMNKTATSRLNLPANATANDYRIEYASVDTKTPGTKTTKMNVYEKLATGGEFMTTYDVSYEVVEVLEDLKVELQEVSIPVGTKTEWLDANAYVKEVRLGDKKLAASEYTAKIVKNPNTNLVSTNTKYGEVTKQKTQITIETKDTKQIKTEETETLIIWGHDITTKSNAGNLTISSVALLENNGKPYLIANQGVGFSSAGLQSDPRISLHRNNISNSLIQDGTSSGINTESARTQDKWNNELDKADIKYGDVFGYAVNDADGVSSLGKKTWATRNEVPTIETEGFDTAYYELTKDGYRLMRFNQFTVNDATLSFEIGTSKEEMDKVAANQLKLPVGADSKDYQIEYASVDTATSGTKTTKMNVYETLATGGQFMTTYDVQYNVSSVLTEKYVDDSGKELKIETQSLNNGQTYQPKPENYLTIDGETYIYQGWLTSSQTAGKDKPTEGNPPAVTSTTTYQYVYSKANNMINVTVPTEMVFGTYKSGSSTISSGKSVVKNNSKDVKTEVIMGEFKKEKSSVTLLKPGQSNSLVIKEKTARLNLTADNKEVIGSLNESDKDKRIKELAPGGETTLGMTGKYYGDLNKPQKVQYKMILKFKVNP